MFCVASKSYTTVPEKKQKKVRTSDKAEILSVCLGAKLIYDMKGKQKLSLLNCEGQE